MNTLQNEYKAKFDSKIGAGTNYIPPVKTTYWSFRLMVGFGHLLVFTVLLGVMNYLIVREVKRGPEALQGVEDPHISDPFNKKVGA